MGSWEGEVWRWNFSWRRDPFTWEIPILPEFLDFIQQFVPSTYEDKWVWRMNVEDGFSVHDCYELLFRRFREPHVVEWCEEVAFEKIGSVVPRQKCVRLRDKCSWVVSKLKRICVNDGYFNNIKLIVFFVGYLWNRQYICFYTAPSPLRCGTD
jgi:hypothetical protein